MSTVVLYQELQKEVYMHPLPIVEHCLRPEQLSSASRLPIVSNYMHCCWERLFPSKEKTLSFRQGHTDELSWEIPVTETVDCDIIRGQSIHISPPTASDSQVVM